MPPSSDPTLGSIAAWRRGLGMSIPISRPKTSTPLDDGSGEGVVPKLLLWAMKDHRRNRFASRDDQLDERVVGEGDDRLYVIDAAARRATAGRLVGSSPDGSTYCLVATVETKNCTELHPAGTTRRLLESGSDFVLCAVYDGGDGVSNVSDVERFARPGDVPAEYLPPSPFIEFEEVL